MRRSPSTFKGTRKAHHRTWRVLRVVVEIPSRGRFSEREMARRVEEALQLIPGVFQRDIDQDFGRVRVKQYNLHRAAKEKA